MDKIKDTKTFMRITHRYLGYFLAGIMAVYAVSGVLLVYRDTDFLKKEKSYEKKFEPNLDEKKLGKEIKIKGFEVDKTEGDVMFFKQGTYNIKTGEKTSVKLVQIAKKREKKKQDGEKINKVKISG